MATRIADFRDLPLLDSQVTPFTFGAKGDYVASTGASVAALSTAFSNSGGVTFTAADVGKAILIDGAGTNGATLTTTIAAISGASATLTGAAVAAAGGGTNYCSGASVATAQSGGGSYVPGDTLTPTGGTSAIGALLAVATTKVVAASVASGGSGGTTGTANVAGTTGVYSQKFVANVTISGGAITAVNSITFAGSYSTNPTSIAAEPVTGAGLTGATLNLTMGVNSASVTNPGNYSVNPTNPVSTTTSGSGTGATLTLSLTATGAWAYATDDTAAIASATSPLYLPKGKNYYTSTALVSFNIATEGRGQIVSGRKTQAPNFISQTAAPSSFGSTGFVGSAFTGDLSRVVSAAGKIISGVATLGQPTSGYLIVPETAMRFDHLLNLSGWNQSTIGNIGRSGVTSHFIKVDQAGGGDAFGLYVQGSVSGAKAGATSFLANPAVAILAGNLTPLNDGVYLNPVEIDTADIGFDVAAINFVANQTRTNDIGALGAVWFGYRSQSGGSAAIDAHFTASGKAKIGIDLSALATNASGTWQQAAMALLGNDRIYFNASAPANSPGYSANPGTSYLFYSTGNSGLQSVINNQPAFLFTSGSAFIYGQTTLAQNSSNKVQVTGAANGSAPSIAATAASDTNQDLKIAALGTGNIQFNNAGSVTANAAIATVLGSLGPTGSHTTVQEWLTVKNPSGTVRYIPCF